jgi:hypothetical protein
VTDFFIDTGQRGHPGLWNPLPGADGRPIAEESCCKLLYFCENIQTDLAKETEMLYHYSVKLCEVRQMTFGRRLSVEKHAIIFLLGELENAKKHKETAVCTDDSGSCPGDCGLRAARQPEAGSR